MRSACDPLDHQSKEPNMNKPPSISRAEIAKDFSQAMDGKLDATAIAAASDALAAADVAYAANGSVASFIFYLQFQVQMKYDYATFDGKGGGVSSPGGGALFGDVYTGNIQALYLDTVSFQFNATPVYLNILFFNSRSQLLGHFESGAISTVAGTGGGAGKWSGEMANWRWCKKCQGLVYVGDKQPATPCPAGGTHVQDGSSNYSLSFGKAEKGEQEHWKGCRHCKCLVYTEAEQPAGRCPAGGTHVPLSSGDFNVKMGTPAGQQQGHWKWCNKCQGLTYAGSEQPAGACPAGGTHTHIGSSDYSLNCR
jgi:hypothetical protein